MKRLRLLLQLLAVFLLLPVVTANAMTADRDTLADPEKEAHARALMSEIRCLVCQNESIAESDADLAHDLRDAIRRQIAAGKTDAEIRSFLVERYGDWILMRTPVNGRTIWLWLMPIILAGAGSAAAFYFIRRGQKGVPDHPLTGAERAALARLKEQPEEKRKDSRS